MSKEVAFDQSSVGLKTLISEGKTKQIYSLQSLPNQVLIVSKDQLTANNAQRKDELVGKARIANLTTCKTFAFLNKIGIPTHFHAQVSDTEFLADKCEMIPIEWVARRIATGSFLKRSAGVKEGYRFFAPKIEMFFKDDAAGDPQWSEEQIEELLHYSKAQIALMRRATLAVFESLERALASVDCQLIDMKIEFGVKSSGEIVVADVIDNDSWRIWPKGDKRLQLDKQVYRDLDRVTEASLKEVLNKYEQVCNLMDSSLCATPTTQVFIVAGSPADLPHCQKISEKASKLGLGTRTHVCSAHKAPLEVLSLSAAAMTGLPTVLIAVAGRSNGLGPVLAGSSPLPVINCPPPNEQWLDKDIWSSLRMPSGMGCVTVLDPEEAALAAAKMLALRDHIVFGHIIGEQLRNYMKIYNAEERVRSLACTDELK